jgi:Na+-driven multidrug efflux pump
VLPSLFAAAPDVRRLLVTVLLVAAAQQPVAGVVFVLDGVLIGAGDQDYLALAGLVTGAVFAIGAVFVVLQHRGLVALWIVFSGWLLARFCTLVPRARGSQWLVTGAVRP